MKNEWDGNGVYYLSVYYMTRKTILNFIKNSGIILLVVFVCSCKKSGMNKQQQQVTKPDSTALSGYTLLWDDEFDGNSLNTSNWNIETGTAYNQEEEYYQAANVTVANGNLVYNCKKRISWRPAIYLRTYKYKHESYRPIRTY